MAEVANSAALAPVEVANSAALVLAADALMEQGPGESRIREAAKNMLREIEDRYDNRMFEDE